MSDQVPTFKSGDRVRIMDTVDMQQRGWAGKRGMVRGTTSRGTYHDNLPDFIIVAGDDGWTYELPPHSLMKE